MINARKSQGTVAGNSSKGLGKVDEQHDYDEAREDGEEDKNRPGVISLSVSLFHVQYWLVAGVPPKSKEVGEESSQDWAYGNAKVADWKSQ